MPLFFNFSFVHIAAWSDATDDSMILSSIYSRTQVILNLSCADFCWFCNSWRFQNQLNCVYTFRCHTPLPYLEVVIVSLAKTALSLRDVPESVLYNAFCFENKVDMMHLDDNIQNAGIYKLCIKQSE